MHFVILLNEIKGEVSEELKLSPRTRMFNFVSLSDDWKFRRAYAFIELFDGKRGLGFLA